MVQIVKLFDFSKEKSTLGWRIVNDVVMGGLSESRFEILEESRACFSGIVSLANGGGFASVKSEPHNFDLSSYQGVILKLRGDGKRYSFRIRTSAHINEAAYEAPFNTPANEWTEVVIPLDSFKPVFRGRVLNDFPPLDKRRIVQFGFMIKERQEGAFRLEIAEIEVFKKGS